MVYSGIMFTVQQLSTLAGITPRTLRHYDAIGLLKPSRIGQNGYRYYEEQAVLRLQQILFYRELDIPLGDIKTIMGQPDFDVMSALKSHRDALVKQARRIKRLIQTVDNTINHLRGKNKMSEKYLFEGFSEEEQEKYALEAENLYDPKTVQESNRKWKAYSSAQKEAILAEGSAIYKDMISGYSKGAKSPEVQAIVGRWRRHMDYFWTPTLDQLLEIANGYVDNPGFRKNFDKMDPRLAEFMQEAVKVYGSENQ